MDTWKLKDLRDGKDYLYVVELESNVLTRRYGWEDGKLRKSTRSYDTAEEARDEADNTIEKKLKEGYELVEEPTVPAPLGSTDRDDPDDPELSVLPVPDLHESDPSLFPIVGLMRLRDAKIKHPVLICAMPDGYRFKVMTSLSYDRSVIGAMARLAYQETAADGVPVDPVLMGWSMSKVRLIKDNREWMIEQSEGGYTVSHGVIGGKTQSKPRPVKPKSNRTFSQQVELEINSKIKKQRDKGYHLPTEPAPRLILPMLAQPYDEGRVQYPVMVQEKLNGVRCIAFCDEFGNVSLNTRKGKPITSMGHIVKELGRFISPGEIWDGEIFHRLHSLQAISGAVRRKKADDFAECLEYWVYDAIMPGTFKERDAHLNAALCKPSNMLRKVQSFTCHSQSGIDLYYDSIVNQKGEGIMIRNPEASYQMDKRTYDLMKRKDFQDAEFEIVGNTWDVDGCVVWVCIAPTGPDSGQWFEVVPAMSRQERQEIDPKLFKGKMLTVRYSDLSNDGIPQGNPVGVCIRDYE